MFLDLKNNNPRYIISEIYIGENFKYDQPKMK